MSTAIYGFSANSISGKPVSLGDYAGKVVLIVNTASKCGFTPQYKGLESLYQKYKDKGLVILGFPCNQFGKQEPGNASQISEFCELNYGVTFPLFDKVDVNGSEAHPLFDFLKNEQQGLFGNAIKWNFTKFLVDRQGRVVRRFAPISGPARIEAAIGKLL